MTAPGLAGHIACLLFALATPALAQQPTPAPASAQAALDRLADGLQVRYTVLGNRVADKCPTPGPCVAVRIELRTARDEPGSDWTISFSNLLPAARVDSDAFTLEPVDGDLVRLRPTRAFTGFRANVPVAITLYMPGHHGNEFEALPNYWLSAPGLQPRTIRSTMATIDPETGLERLPYLDPFTDEERQFRIADNERIRWMTPTRLYAANATRPPVPAAHEAAILPTPVTMRRDPYRRMLDVTRGVRVVPSGVERSALSAALARLARQGVRETAGGVPLTIAVRGGGKPESYRLTIGATGIAVVAADAAGAFYAIESLASLAGSGVIPRATVEDAPRYGFRGLHMDVARNFHSKALVLSLLDQMAALKLNRFHLHLGDDEGWRLQIPELPELTEVGARRCDDPAEDRCLLPQLGAGPGGVSPVNGYYSVADFHDILRAAAARHIEVIPSFDMPGHSRSSIRAMEARYRRYMAAGDPVAAARYRLIDPADRSVYASIQNYHDNTLNPCVPGTYAFFEEVVSAVQRMYADVGLTLKTYHIGADETAGAWRDSPACAAMIARGEATSPQQLGGVFVERLAAILDRRGITTAAWRDGLTHADPARLPKNVQANEWQLLKDGAHRSTAADVNRGWQVVLSIPDASYLDFPSLADPKERGYYWGGRQIDERRVFDYMPDNLPALAEEWTDQSGLPLSLDDRPTATERPMDAGKAVAGIQAQLWSEILRSDDQVEYMALPRLAFFAERAWHRAGWEVPYDHAGVAYSPTSGRFTPAMRAARDADWNRVAGVVVRQVLPEWDRERIAYRIPVPGATVTGGKLACNVILPGLPVEYRSAGGTWQRCERAVPVADAPIEVRATSPDGKRPGRAAPVR
jgi:hexosaminidase